MDIKHKHHIIPKHMDGTNDKSNIVELTIEEHAQLHKKLYEEHGHWEDKIAWKTLSGQITNKEANRLKRIESNKERWADPEFKERISKKISEAHKKLNKTIPKNCTFKGLKQTEKQKNAVSEYKTNYWSNPENRKKMSEKMKEIRKHKLWSTKSRSKNSGLRPT